MYDPDPGNHPAIEDSGFGPHMKNWNVVVLVRFVLI
jgi:hypothetical protein